MPVQFSPVSQQLEEMENERINNNQVPKIKNTSLKKDNIMRKYSLQKVERQILFKKYIRLGFTGLEADKKVKGFCTFLKDLVNKLKKADKDEHYIEIKVNEAFEIHCRTIDSERGE
jgi:hypothetical protein